MTIIKKIASIIKHSSSFRPSSNKKNIDKKEPLKNLTNANSDLKKIRFEDLNLHEFLLRGITQLDWKYTTPIQKDILPRALKGFDMIGKAQTGTGKTAAFLVTIIEHCLRNRLKKHSKASPRALIIAPTRELAIQIGKDSKQLNAYSKLRTVI